MEVFDFVLFLFFLFLSLGNTGSSLTSYLASNKHLLNFLENVFECYQAQFDLKQVMKKIL